MIMKIMDKIQGLTSALRSPAKGVNGEPFRGFESHPLRQSTPIISCIYSGLSHWLTRINEAFQVTTGDEPTRDVTRTHAQTHWSPVGVGFRFVLKTQGGA